KFHLHGANHRRLLRWELNAGAANGELPIPFLVHGGPQGSFSDSWSFRWNPRVFISPGYATVSVDFHGSTGYGQAFTDAINRNWGGWPLEDLQKGLAFATAHDPQLDAGRACALGGSYGGYMMNWIEGNWPDRFKCIVQHDGVFDARAMAYETEELWFDEWEHGGHAYYEAPAEFERLNPVNFDPKSIEERWYAHWEGRGLFRPDRPDATPWTIVMPPPNVTGSLHIGHALDITLQDVLTRRERMRGKDALWVVGTDHAGIATQM